MTALATGNGTPDRTTPIAGTNEASQPPRPAAQIAPVVVSLAHTGNGTERLTLRLEPAELGQVHIQIESSQESPAKVEITVERPDTMTLLLRDQHDLHRALDQAGVPANGRTLSFQLASQDQQSPGNGHGPSSGLSSSGAGTNGSSSNGGGSGGMTGRHRGRDAEIETALPQSTRTRWINGALDITA
ncbi:MAG: flagellar hook-length control protein FliK [Acetobacteraceae bacterium]|nr:flagellar hook-length control protein FliK [Acetobacteraceae bacterium]